MSEDKVVLSVKISRELRKRFREVLVRKDKTVREILPKIVGEWVNKNGG